MARGEALGLVAGAQGNSVLDLAYMLGLEDNDPHHIVLRKGVITVGLPSVAIGQQGILARPFSTAPRWLRFGLPPDDAGRQRLAAALKDWA